MPESILSLALRQALLDEPRGDPDAMTDSVVRRSQKSRWAFPSTRWTPAWDRIDATRGEKHRRRQMEEEVKRDAPGL
jgi:hypothetical protein